MIFRIRAASDLLEPYALKDACTDLRGGGGGDTLALPGGKQKCFLPTRPADQPRE